MIMALILFITFRNSPEKFGLKPDGDLVKSKETMAKTTAVKPFTRREALRTRAFWMYSLTLSFSAYFVTGLTFHIISIFSTAGYNQEEALSFFLPMSIVSLCFSILFNALSDKLKLKSLLYVMILGSVICSSGLTILNYTAGFYLLIVGVGIMTGLYAVLSSVVWPRFFGRKHLGAISGVNMQMIVFSSAMGPYLFRVCL